ncbi:3-deoxy-manno-octulosonate cytidylyltransferase [Flavihumibacter sp. R14]|nr:3-deoxy-manno-octulosonate cytidylyltransferase [Flavihumibacter soli]
MKITGIIPARYASTRFPGKPLIDIGGKSMIRRVYEQALKSKLLSEVVVSTDDQRIYDHVSGFGGSVQMTSATHQSGTDRCAETALYYEDSDVFVNIQGDEPFIDPKQIDLLCSCFSEPQVDLATLIKKITDIEELRSPNSPKVIINNKDEAIYFSRTPIPFLRDHKQDTWLQYQSYYKHIGIYGYRREALNAITKLRVSSLESAEALEQLRWIENGYTIKVAVTTIESIAIDTPSDLSKALSQIDLALFK